MDRLNALSKVQPGPIDYLGGQGFDRERSRMTVVQALTYFRWVLARRIEAEGNTARAA